MNKNIIFNWACVLIKYLWLESCGIFFLKYNFFCCWFFLKEEEISVRTVPDNEPPAPHHPAPTHGFCGRVGWCTLGQPVHKNHAMVCGGWFIIRLSSYSGGGEETGRIEIFEVMELYPRSKTSSINLIPERYKQGYRP